MVTDDQLNHLTNVITQLNEKTDTLAKSVSRIDAKVEKTKYITKLLDVEVQYPAENDVLVYDKTGKWKNAQYDEIGLLPGEGTNSGNIHIIGIGDPTPPTNQNVYSAALIHQDYFKKGFIADEDGSQYVYNPIVLKKHEEGTTPYMIVDNIKSTDAIQDSFAGKGLIYKINSKGRSYLEVDDLAVRRAATFNHLEIKKVTAVGGNLVISVAANVIHSVEEASTIDGDTKVNVWRCRFKNSESGDNGENTKISNDFIKDDLVRIQEFNISQSADHVQNRFFWGRVVSTGDGYIDIDKKGLDGTNTTPKAGDNLVQYGNLTNKDRSNIITISAYSNNAPSIIMYQGVGINEESGQSTIEMAYDNSQDQNQAYMNVYGRMYIGNRDQSSYVKFDPTLSKVQIKAEVVFEGTDELAQDLIAKKLGYIDWNEMSLTGKTIIKGGMINTDLLNAQVILGGIGFWEKEIKVGKIDEEGNYHFTVNSSGNLTIQNSSKIAKFRVTNEGILTAQDASVSGEINATSGSFSNININGVLNMNGGSLTGTDVNNKVTLNATSLSFYGNKDFYESQVAIGTDGTGVLPSISGVRMPVGIYTKLTNPAMNVLENVGLYISASGAKKYANASSSGNTAIHISDGFIKGLRLNVTIPQDEQLDSEGHYTPTKMDNYIVCTSTRINGINLPSDAQEGQFYIIKKYTHNSLLYIRVKGNGFISQAQGEYKKNDKAVNGSRSFILVYTEAITYQNQGIWLVNTTLD